MPLFRNTKDREFAVIGLGRFGRSVVRTLMDRGHSVLGIDRDAEAAQYMSKDGAQIAILDSTDEDALRSIDIASFDTVVVAIGTDFESNLITTVALKSLGVRRVISKALSRRQKEILLRVGADEVVQPEADAGHRLAIEITAPNMLDQIPLGDSHSILELRVPLMMVGKSLADLDFRNKYDANIVAVRHEDAVTVSPQSNFVLSASDVIVVIGRTDVITRLTRLE